MGKIFKSLVNGYRRQLQQPNNVAGRFVGFPKGPVEVTGAIKILEDEKKKPETEGIEGIKIPRFETKGIRLYNIEETKELGQFKTSYSLIPSKPSKSEPIFAYAKIGWNSKKNQYEYNVIQPKLSKKMKRIIFKIRELLEEKLDIDFSKLRKLEAKDYLHKQISELIDYFGMKLTQEEKKILFYYIDKDFLGLGLIEPLLADPEIEDISCDGVDVPIYIFHRNSILSSIPTNLSFSNSEDLDSYLVRLAQLCGQSISVVDPLLGGSLPDGSRIQGTLATDIARKGSNFTIRKFTKEPLTPTHLLNYDTVDVRTLAFLWLTVDYECSILISGGTATGKTVLLNAISLFIRQSMKIISIEDTSELKLPHSHWVPHVARVPISIEKSRGEIDLFDLLRESLRQRPDYIIVGEVRGKETYVLFQQMATGHPSLATIHSDSIEKLVDRLITPPISLPSSLIQDLDLVIFLTKLKYKGKYVRKMSMIYEIMGFDFDKNRPKLNKVVEWDAGKNKFNVVGKSVLLKKITKKRGLTEKQIVEELKRRMLVLYWLQQKNITNFKDISNIINLYYNHPERVLSIISSEISGVV